MQVAPTRGLVERAAAAGGAGGVRGWGGVALERNNLGSVQRGKRAESQVIA